MAETGAGLLSLLWVMDGLAKHSFIPYLFIFIPFYFDIQPNRTF
jgi:hypothetical protein